MLIKPLTFVAQAISQGLSWPRLRLLCRALCNTQSLLALMAALSLPRLGAAVPSQGSALMRGLFFAWCIRPSVWLTSGSRRASPTWPVKPARRSPILARRTRFDPREPYAALWLDILGQRSGSRKIAVTALHSWGKPFNEIGVFSARRDTRAHHLITS